jgi:ketosteroid isomerase-like protein
MRDKEDAMTTPVSRNAVIAFFQAYSSRDPVRIAPFIADDVEWMIVGPVDLLQFCGRRKGKEAVIDLFQRVIPNVLDVSGVESDIVLVDGDRAATYNRITAIQRTTGRTISYRSAQFMRFRNDKVIEYRSIIDSFDAAEQVLGHPIELPADICARTATPA